MYDVASRPEPETPAPLEPHNDDRVERDDMDTGVAREARGVLL